MIMANSSILLSIITVTRNCSQTLQRTLKSVACVKSKYIEYIEYIVVDGASVDGTLDVLKSSGDLIDTLLSEPDSGIYDAMNKAVGLARGEYVLFINGDDELIEDGFKVVIPTLERRFFNIICASTLARNDVSSDEVLVAKPSRLMFFNSVPHPSSFVRRELLLRSPFREDLRIVSDYDFFLGAYLAGQSFCVLSVLTALHQRGGASGDVLRSQEELEFVRRDRLGWRYPLINAAASLYRKCKRVIGGKPV